ncbi:MAG TPA: amino acid adenylation domain-containing protein, partial [Pyrinomonadaceae bacterium]|nr:amino acid adenylation domain-containing protein [Pyrinomonadaceae bacterium]
MSHEAVNKWFARLAQEEPAAVAVSVRGEETTYGELAAGAQRVAAKLWAEGCGTGTIIGVLANESLSHITSMLGALNAGAAFAPLDPNLPAERLRAMLELIEPGCVIVEPSLMERAAALCNAKMKMLRLQGVNLLDETDGDPCPVSGGPDSLAYIYFTSGSSGVPKAIAGRLQGIDHFIRWEIEQLGLQRGVRVSQLLPLSFDGSLRDVFVALCSGGRVCVPPSREVVLEAGKLLEWLEAERVNVMHCVPSLFRAMVNEGLRAEQLSALRYILMAGEVLQPADVKRWMSVYGERVQLINLYGTTETTMAKFAYFVKAADTERRFIPVGKPIPGAKALLINEKGKPCAAGMVGEIYIRTPYRSLGYYRQPELTAEVFIPNPFSNDSADIVYKTGDLGRQLEDGNYEYVGRRDGQVKVRGQRVELGEVEEVIRQHESVHDVAVAERVDESGYNYLCAYVVVSDEAVVGELWERMREHLPDYMVPAAVVVMQELPRTISGKVDRRALPAPATGRAGLRRPYVPPRTAIEEILVDIWSEVLGGAKVGIHDNFFELGGHSLLATRLLSRVRASFALEVPLRKLFAGPTVATLATHIETGLRSDQETLAPPLRVVERDGDLPLSFAQQRLWFIDQLEPGLSTYNISTAVRLSGELKVTALERALSEVVRRHEALRTTFPTVDGLPVQRITEACALQLPLVDLSGMVAPEAEVERLASEEAQRPFDLSVGPLLRAQLLRVTDEEHVVVVTMHHIVSDGWSMNLLVREVSRLYEAYRSGQESPLPELPIQYADYAAWQREWLNGEVLDRELSYWREQLAGAPPVLELPADHVRPPVQTFRGARQSFVIDASV